MGPKEEKINAVRTSGATKQVRYRVVKALFISCSNPTKQIGSLCAFHSLYSGESLIKVRIYPFRHWGPFVLTLVLNWVHS